MVPNLDTFFSDFSSMQWFDVAVFLGIAMLPICAKLPGEFVIFQQIYILTSLISVRYSYILIQKYQAFNDQTIRIWSIPMVKYIWIYLDNNAMYLFLEILH